MQVFRDNSMCTLCFNIADDRISKKDHKPIGLKDGYGELKKNITYTMIFCIQNFQQPIKLPPITLWYFFQKIVVQNSWSLARWRGTNKNTRGSQSLNILGSEG